MNINNPYLNLTALLVFSMLSVFLIQSSGYLDNVGMAALIANWIPLIIGVVASIFYLISRLIFKKYNWIITLLALLYLVFIIVRAFTSEPIVVG